MDFANYNGHTYLFHLNRRTKQYEIVTEQIDKTDSEFKNGKHCYYKEIPLSDNDLTDIFDIDLWVKYDTGYEGCPTEWGVGLGGRYTVENRKIPLWCADGYIPGWEVMGKYESRGFIDPEDIQAAWVLYQYQKKDGVLLDEPLVVREDISFEQLLELQRQYGNGAL